MDGKSQITQTRAPPVFRANRFWGPRLQSIHLHIPFYFAHLYHRTILCFTATKKKRDFLCEKNLECSLYLTRPPFPGNRLFCFSCFFVCLSVCPDLSISQSTQSVVCLSVCVSLTPFSICTPTCTISHPCVPKRIVWGAAIWSKGVHF